MEGSLDAISATWRRAFDWIEAELGGEIVHAERQARWRPAWSLDLARDGERVPLYFRGERGETDHGVYTLEHEMRVLQVLEQHDVPVPHVHGFCPDPPGIIMQRCPGRANLGTSESESERAAVLDHYMDLLVRMHRIDIGAFEVVGMKRPATAEQIGLCDFDTWERAYRRDRRRPEPAIEYLVGWIRRNVPRGRERLSFICGDAGQFLFERDRVTAVLDLELACLGDPAADLGAMRGRDLSEPLGDLRRAFLRYEAQFGERIDPAVIDFHTVRFNAVTPLALARLVADPPPGTDLIQYLSWYLVWTRTALDVIARGMGLDLTPPTLPAGIEDATSAQRSAEEGSFDAYQADAAGRLALYRERREAYGPALEVLDLDDVGAILGRRPAGRAEADAELEAFVTRARPEDDAALVACLRRRLLREEAVLGPVLGELRDAQIQCIR